MLQRVAVRGRPDRLRHVPEVEAARVVRAVAEDREGGEAGGVRGDRDPEQHFGRGRPHSEPLEQPAPPGAEHVLARPLLVGGAAALRDRRARARGRPRAVRSASASAAGSPGGTSSALSPSREQLARAGVSAVTSGVPQASAWNALFGITRAAFAGGAEDPERAAAPVELGRQPLVSIQGTHSTFGGRRRRAARRAGRCRRC